LLLKRKRHGLSQLFVDNGIDSINKQVFTLEAIVKYVAKPI